MAILTIAVSLTAPALAGFFRGRSLDSQARGLLSLTRQAQSRAITEGIPVEIWVDSDRSSLHLEAEPSYEPNDPREVDFPLFDEVQIEFLNTGQALAAADSAAAVTKSRHNGPKMRFLPDGTISEISPTLVRLTGRDGFSTTLVQATNRLCYEIVNAKQ